ncbi:hypothetical protein NX722_12400 [Endozoicomonas gorgoniicola]|uniref:Uncharacterized protein n=1 Tax=Endozoicomonas gorgoniicola TaxID=1234144 RepID=A0ABT3MVP8_9GAMM|nr:hypothetical protein [Endozoicomonas gorgoniicola]MCW7553420.1 hypothetical protein [Endozoicomonas gorgoniicola]
MKKRIAHIILFSMVLFFFPSARAVNFQQFIIQLNGMSLLEITKRQEPYSPGTSYDIRAVSPANGQLVQYNLEPDTSDQVSASAFQSLLNWFSVHFWAPTFPDSIRENSIHSLLQALILTHHNLGYRSFAVTIHGDGNAELSMRASSGSRIQAETTLHSAGSAPWDSFLDSTSTSDNRLLHYFFNHMNHAHLLRFIILPRQFSDAVGFMDLELHSSNRRFDSNLNVQVSQRGEETLVLNVVGVVDRNGLPAEVLQQRTPFSAQFGQLENLLPGAPGAIGEAVPLGISGAGVQ